MAGCIIIVQLVKVSNVEAISKLYFYLIDKNVRVRPMLVEGQFLKRINLQNLLRSCFRTRVPELYCFQIILTT